MDMDMEEMKMQGVDRDLSNSNPENGASNPQPPAFPNHSSTFHRRSHSEVSFRFPGASSSSVDIYSDPFAGSEDDLFNSYIDVLNLGHPISNANVGSDNNPAGRPRHRYSNSVDASSFGSRAAEGTVFGEIMDAKKAMPPDQLAELWSLDPKRAKRILANRQSASRSKQRKAHHMLELEKKVQELQTESTTLSAHLSLYQRDTTNLTNQNAELRLHLCVLEQQAQLRDAMNEALKQEVEKLRIATGQIRSSSEAIDLGMASIPSNVSGYYSAPQQHLHLQNSQQMSEFLQNDPLGRLKGLDIKSESRP